MRQRARRRREREEAEAGSPRSLWLIVTAVVLLVGLLLLWLL